MILKIFGILMVILGTWFILDQNYYSPKAQIKRLWKMIHRLSLLVPKENTWVPSNGIVEKKRNQIGKLINSFLDFYFDPEEDEEYIRENRYIDEYIEHENFTMKQANSLFIQKEDWSKIEKFLEKN